MTILERKAAIVTGAGRGVGKGHALHLARAGASIVVNDIDPAEAKNVVREIEASGGRAIASGSDIGTRAGATALIEECARSFGGVDVLVNNAGILRDRTLLKMTDDEFNDVWRIHVMGTFWCAQTAAAHMRDHARGGSIINTTSAAHMGNFGQTAYSAAKGAIASMTYTWALELARYGIRVNAISPMGTTRMSATFKGPDGKEVSGPYLDPALNGPMVVFLASDEAQYVTGQIFGTGGDRLTILSQPRYGHTMIKPGGWGLDDIKQHFKAHFGNRLEPLGIEKAPYPFYAGVKPDPRSAR